jgi:hypothetical protein
VVAKKPAKPRTKSTSAPSAAAGKKTASQTVTSRPAPAASAINVSKYAVGDLISHPMFGNGTVAAVDDAKLTIKFAGDTVKQIVDSYVRPRRL